MIGVGTGGFDKIVNNGLVFSPQKTLISKIIRIFANYNKRRSTLELLITNSLPQL